MKKFSALLLVSSFLIISYPRISNARFNEVDFEVTINISLSTGLLPVGVEVNISNIYFIITDSSGTVIFEAIPGAHYNIRAFKIGYDVYTLNNIVFNEDKVINIVLSEKKYPPTCLTIDPISLEGTWCEPLITALDQDFEDPMFPPAGWQIDPEEDGWERTDSNSTPGWEIPEWDSFYAVSLDGCCDYLITPPIDLRESEGYALTFDSFYDGGFGQLAFVEYSLDGGETWEVIYQVMPDPGWTEKEINLDALSGPGGPELIWFAFHADDNGGWASGWAIDNVKIQVPDQPANYIDFWVFLDDTLVAETTNTHWDFAPLIYGQTFTASVAARYTSGLSSKDYYTFYCEYLFPPDSLEGYAPDDAAILTWYPPLEYWPEAENGSRDVGDVIMQFPAPSPISLCWGICDDGNNLWITDPNASATTIYEITYEGVNTGTTICVSQGQSYIGDMVCDGEFLYGCLVGGPNSIVKVALSTGETIGTITGDWTITTQRGLSADFINQEFYIGGWNSNLIWRTDFDGNTIATFGFAGVSGLAWHPNGGPASDGALWVMMNEINNLVTELDPNNDWVMLQSFLIPGGQQNSGAGMEMAIGGPLPGGLWIANQSDNTIYLVDTDEPYNGPIQPELPENILGYNLYRDGTFVAYTPHTPEGEYVQQGYVDEGIQPGMYEYTVTAVYDLTPYGFPGDSAESAEEGPAEIIGWSCFELDFIETWDLGNFEDNNWFTGGDNWSVSGQEGEPAPAAEFSWEPVQENYSIALESNPICVIGMTEGKIFMDFDLKLDALEPTGEERLIVQVLWDWESEEWDTVAEYSNAGGSFGWTSEHIDITPQAMNKVFRVRFLATGVNSVNILSWFVDNINIYRICEGPYDLTADPFNQGALLEWEAPGSRELTLYNIYRRLEGEDYILVDYSSETAYFDTNLPVGNSYCYKVSALWESEYDMCESPFSNEACMIVGIENHDPDPAFTIYPNPATDYLVIVPGKPTPDREITVSLYNSAGKLFLLQDYRNDGEEIRLNLDGYPSGIYCICLKSGHNIIGTSRFVILTTKAR